MAKLKRSLRFLFFSWPMVAGSLLVLWLFAQSTTGAQLYGRFYPVTTPLQVTSVVPADVSGAPGSRIAGTATLNREQCDYLDIQWTLHGDAKNVRATAFFADEAQVRRAGVQQWEALLVGVPPHKLKETTGDVVHRCGLFPVMTPFFRPDQSILPEAVGAKARCVSGAFSGSTGPGTCSGHGGVEEWLNG